MNSIFATSPQQVSQPRLLSNEEINALAQNIRVSSDQILLQRSFQASKKEQMEQGSINQEGFKTDNAPHILPTSEISGQTYSNQSNQSRQRVKFWVAEIQQMLKKMETVKSENTSLKTDNILLKTALQELQTKFNTYEKKFEHLEKRVGQVEDLSKNREPPQQPVKSLTLQAEQKLQSLEKALQEIHQRIGGVEENIQKLKGKPHKTQASYRSTYSSFKLKKPNIAKLSDQKIPQDQPSFFNVSSIESQKNSSQLQRIVSVKKKLEHQTPFLKKNSQCQRNSRAYPKNTISGL